MKKRSGFTLVEILIVVVILGILAAIVIPQFTDASTEAKESALASDLQMMRSQLELYKIQHDYSLPPTTSFANFQTALTEASGGYGPYMQKIPTNPFTSSNTFTFVDQGSLAANTNVGWNMDPNTGEIHPTDADHLTD